ncbi:hypothetical protein RLOC_00005959 [Lonchura striata]|uniref:Uncharacterized protein n=1 Tax=Lonchura striata TaxID=40157 RepID=A0A218VFP1_9PASE|nr:hypothetical protein RLOC_00005959 [Lonchura striata domestica]
MIPVVISKYCLGSRIETSNGLNYVFNDDVETGISPFVETGFLAKTAVI